jgi:hypothetical protein
MKWLNTLAGVALGSLVLAVQGPIFGVHVGSNARGAAAVCVNDQCARSINCPTGCSQGQNWVCTPNDAKSKGATCAYEGTAALPCGSGAACNAYHTSTGGEDCI